MPGTIELIRDVNGRIDELLGLYRAAWWARDRTPDDVAVMLANTPVQLGLVDTETGELVAFCRALTDRAYLAVILDVIVSPTRRDEGLGARLMDEVLAVPEVNAAASVELVCQPELVPFYRRWGFTDDVGRSGLMRRAKRATR